MSDNAPTPWSRSNFRGYTEIFDADNKFLFGIRFDDELADKILHCVNSHAALVEALDEALKLAWMYLHEWEDAGGDDYPEEHEAINKLKAALAAAKGETNADS